jgi:hypothetical protein
MTGVHHVEAARTVAEVEGLLGIHIDRPATPAQPVGHADPAGHADPVGHADLADGNTMR